MLAAFWRGEITLRKLRVLLNYLPDNSPVNWHTTDGKAFTGADSLAWQSLWATAAIAQSMAGKGNNVFKNMPQFPWTKAKPENQSTFGSLGDHSPEEVLDYLDSL